MKKRSFFSMLLALSVTAWAVSPAISGDQPEGPPSKSSLPKVTMEEALKTALKHVPGRVVEAELEEEDEATFYEIEIIDSDGMVREILVDANSGQIIKAARQGEVSYKSVQEAIQLATEYYRWHVVEIELEEDEDEAVYEVELVNQAGETREIEVDALSGQVIVPESQIPETDSEKESGQKSE